MTEEIKRKRGRPRKTELVTSVVKRGRGRPKKEFKKQKEKIIIELANGRSLRSICKDKDMPDRGTVIILCNNDEQFSRQYALARQFQADYYADMIIDQTQTLLDRAMAGEAQPCEVASTNAFVDARKWKAAKLSPKKYGKLAEMMNENGEIEKISEIKITIENPVDLRKKAKAKKNEA